MASLPRRLAAYFGPSGSAIGIGCSGKWLEGEIFLRLEFAATAEEMAMMESVVNNPNIFFDASDGAADATLGQRDHDGEPRPEADAALLHQVSHVRRQIEETACSST